MQTFENKIPLQRGLNKAAVIVWTNPLYSFWRMYTLKGIKDTTEYFISEQYDDVIIVVKMKISNSKQYRKGLQTKI